MSKRITVTVEWWKDFYPWRIIRNGRMIGAESMKKSAVWLARDICRSIAGRGGLVELIVKTKSGRIGKGSGSRATYGRDPRKTKG